jgi:hypothetical protein
MGKGAVLLGRLDEFDPRWKPIIAAGMAERWFEHGSIHEVADVLVCSYLERARQPLAGLRLVDRGMPMLEASVAATLAVREKLAAGAAAERAAALLAAYEQDIRRAEAAEFQGAGYSDIEVALLTEAGLVTAATVIVTTVHSLQVLDEPLPETAHDFSVDMIVTPDEIIHCQPPRRPGGLDWDSLPSEMVAAIPRPASPREQPRVLKPATVLSACAGREGRESGLMLWLVRRDCRW